MTWFCFGGRDQQASALATAVASDLEQLLRQKRRVTLCVPGGTTPSLFFRYLSQKELDWQRVRLVLSDERWVPLDHPLSNEGLLRHQLVQNKAVDAEVLSLFDASLPIDDAVAQINQSPVCQVPIDLCVLGMGEDGHTASLFPAMGGLSSALDKHQAAALVVARIADKQELRVSWNLSALLRASRHYVLICGEEKHRIALEANKESSLGFPISYLFVTTDVDIYFAD